VARAVSTPQTGSLARRILGSVWLKMLVFVLLFLLLATLVTNGTGTRVQEKQVEFLTDAVRRSAVQCYALEGRFPDNLSYLEDNYSLIIDHDSYVVYYEPMGGNLIPQIRVMPVAR
jgi:hypothetical protein